MDKGKLENINKEETFWRDNVFSHLKPGGFGMFPEGFDVRVLLNSLVYSLAQDTTIVDFGCGDGRLCRAFYKRQYLGIDINEEALQKARRVFNEYDFQQVQYIDYYPPADIYLAYTTCLHINDEDLPLILNRISFACQKYFILCEILGREWRRDGVPFVYNRTFQEYLSLLQEHYYELFLHLRFPYKRYIDDDAFRDKKNKNMSVMVFKKNG